MENKNINIIKEHFLNIRELILYAILDSDVCKEIEIVTGFHEKDFSFVASEMYNLAQNLKEDNIVDIVNIRHLIIARSCISRAEGSFGVYSRIMSYDEDIVEKYEKEKNFIANLIKIIESIKE